MDTEVKIRIIIVLVLAALLCVAAGAGLYFLLRKRTQKTQKVVLFSLLLFALILHFLKCFFPPYSVDRDRLYRDIFFINICAANICVFPFIYLGKSKTAKDYMFYLGVLGGGVALLYPMEPLNKGMSITGEWLDVIRYYIHHAILCIVPTLMVLFGHHKLDYKRVWKIPSCLMLLFVFIMFNQLLQSELGFVDLHSSDSFLEIGYKNSSYIWGADDSISRSILSPLCPNIFKYVPVGEHAGQMKYWPWVWMIVPVHVLALPLCFGLCMIFEHKQFGADMVALKQKIKAYYAVVIKTHKGGKK